ncbi:MAG: hypothetical protein KGJ13_09425 [Patescibacteria group bacterium]|nr:hypothetical protein [Patescibacteria group bacterium]
MQKYETIFLIQMPKNGICLRCSAVKTIGMSGLCYRCSVNQSLEIATNFSWRAGMAHPDWCGCWLPEHGISNLDISEKIKAPNRGRFN